MEEGRIPGADSWVARRGAGLGNRVRAKRSSPGHPENQPQFAFHLVNTSEGVGLRRQLSRLSFSAQVSRTATSHVLGRPQRGSRDTPVCPSPGAPLETESLLGPHFKNVY